MSLFNRKTVLDDGIESYNINAILGIDDLSDTFTGGDLAPSNLIFGAGAAADAQREAAALAAKTTLETTEKNIDFQKWLWGEQKDLTQDYVDAGGRALSKYETAIEKPFGQDELELDPGYQFRLDEGSKALENSAAARGMSLSGGNLKDISRWSQSYASDEFNKAYGRRQDYLNRLSGLVGVGQASSVMQAQQGTSMGGQVSQSILAGGQATADMYSNLGNINSAEAMAGGKATMDIASLAASFYTGGISGAAGAGTGIVAGAA